MVDQAELGIREDFKSIEFDAIQLTQPIGDFFIGKMTHKELCDIAFFDVRKVLKNDRDFEEYLGIQRRLSVNRVKQLKNYVTFYDATFPTSVVLAVDERCAEYDTSAKILRLSNVQADGDQPAILFRDIARVLDGQHRIAGLFDLPDEFEFEINVTVFVGADMADQAQIFSTVNLHQTKVAKSLAYDLFALAKSRSPQKSCHNVAVALNQKKGGPLYHRIKRLGLSTPGRYGETITQATFVEALIKYITKDPQADRDNLIRGKRIKLAEADDLERTPLRNLFLNEEDLKIATLISNYFEAISQRWPSAWGNLGKGKMLNKTNGFKASMRVFGSVYLHIAGPGDVPGPEDFLKMFSKVKLEDDDFDVEVYQPGSAGEGKLANNFMSDMGLSR